MGARKPGSTMALSGAELATALKGHQFVVFIPDEDERYTVEVTGETSMLGDLVAKVVAS